MRQVFTGWGVAVKRKAAGLFTIYFPHPLLHVRTSHNVEIIIYGNYSVILIIMEVFFLCVKTNRHGVLRLLYSLHCW